MVKNELNFSINPMAVNRRKIKLKKNQ